MSDILASSITLEDILTVAQSKRVPIAPELAGYLTLELSDAVNAGGVTEIDPKTVYVSEEGSVAIVKPKSAGSGEDVESQLRRVLGDLLAVTGSQTTALSQVAKRKSGGGVRALSGELEAALIPVNRAAGRRALARMAREARRISLGLGRAGALPSLEPRKPPDREDRDNRDVERAFHEAPTNQRPRTPFPTDEAATIKRTGPSDSGMKIPVPPAARGPVAAPPPPLRAPPRKGAALPPVPDAGKPVVLGPPEKLFGGDEVDSLLDSFGVTGDASDDDKAMSHELKSLVGLGPTPPPPGTEANFEDADGNDRSDQIATHRLATIRKEEPTLDPPGVKARAESRGKMLVTPPPLPVTASSGDGIEDLLAMSDPSVPDVRAQADSLANERAMDDDELPKPIAVATVKKADAGSSSRMRAAKAAAEAKAQQTQEAAARRPVVAPPKPSNLAQAGAPAIAPPPTPPAAGAGAFAKVPDTTPIPSGREPRAPKTGFIFLVMLLIVIGIGVVAVWKLAPGFFTGRTPENIQKEKADYEAQKAAIEKAAEEQRCKASLIISDAPAGSEVLLRVGQAPTDVVRMPMKTRLEFVATAEGFAPRRAVVLPTVPWLPTKPPHVEIAVQLDASKAKAPALDPWPAGEPGADVGGQGEPGTVHVVSTPPGAEIWLLAGLGPEARIDQLKCDEGVEVLVAGSQVRKRLRMVAGDAAKAPADSSGAHVVKLSAKTD